MAVDIGSRRLRGRIEASVALPSGAPATIVVRPERVRLSGTTSGPVPGAERWAGRVTQAIYLGHSIKYEVVAEGWTVIARVALAEAAYTPAMGDEVWLEWMPDDARIVPGRVAKPGTAGEH